MVETFLNTRTGAVAPTDGSRSHLRAQARAATPAPDTRQALQSTAPNAAQPFGASTVAPGLLIAAQQVRDTDRARTFDARQTYGGPANNGNAQSFENESAQAGTAEVVRGAEILPFPTPPRQSGFSGDAAAQQTSTQGSGDFSRANRAYVHAGAADGRAFAQQGLDTTLLRANANTFDLII